MMKCPVCKNEFDEYTGRMPKKFCSKACKIKWFNSHKKVQVADLNKQTETNQVKPPETSNVTIDTRTEMQKRFDELKQQNLSKLRNHE